MTLVLMCYDDDMMNTYGLYDLEHHIMEINEDVDVTTNKGIPEDRAIQSMDAEKT